MADLVFGCRLIEGLGGEMTPTGEDRVRFDLLVIGLLLRGKRALHSKR